LHEAAQLTALALGLGKVVGGDLVGAAEGTGGRVRGGASTGAVVVETALSAGVSRRLVVAGSTPCMERGGWGEEGMEEEVGEVRWVIGGRGRGVFGLHLND